MTSSRRQFLAHAGALGLGALFLPSLSGVARADETSTTPLDESPEIVFETIEAGGLAHYSYFLGDKSSGQAVVIDPRRDVDVYLELARRNGLDIVYSVETHVHADFLSGARELADRSPDTKVCASREGGARYGFPIDRKLSHGDKLKFGKLTLTALHTPGHTPEHMSYLATSPGSGEHQALVTGDFLFVGSVGRPDLMGVENTEKLASLLFQTVQTGYKDLPDSLPIYPAHGPGSPCGAGIRHALGAPTLGRERRTNPYLQRGNESNFKKTLLAAQPPVPYYWPRMKKINAEGPKILGGDFRSNGLSPGQLADLLKSSETQLLDTRQACAYAGGFVPGSFNIGYDPVLSLWAGWIIDPDKPLAIIVPSEGDAQEVTAWLARVGLEENLVGHLEGGMKSWINNALPFENYPTMSVHQVKETFPSEDLQLLDVRQPSEWDKGHLPGARYIFLPELVERQQELDKSKPVITYCGNGYRASIAAGILRQAGFDARSVPGSYTAWTAAGYPVETLETSRRASDTIRP